MGALLPPQHQEESHRQSSAATTKSTLPKQGRDDLEVFFQTNKLLSSYVEKRAKSSRPLWARVTTMSAMYSATWPRMLCSTLACQGPES